MHSIAILSVLGFVASATAIDVILHRGGTCNGISQVYKDRNPSDCIANGEAWGSVSFTGIPTAWNIRGKIHSQGGCNSLIRSFTSNNQAQRICFEGQTNPRRIRSADYDFVNKKRGEEVVEGKRACKRADTLILEDGSSFNVTVVEEIALTEMLNEAEAGTISESLEQLREIPAEVKI